MKTNIALLIEQSVNVIDSLNKGLRLTPEEQQFFCEHFEREEIKKNEFTIRIGDYEKYLYFIESGSYVIGLHKNMVIRQRNHLLVFFPGRIRQLVLFP